MIKQLDSRGKVVASYKNVQDASTETGIHAYNIKRVLSGERKSAGGFTWIEGKKTSKKKDKAKYTDEDVKNIVADYLEEMGIQPRNLSKMVTKSNLPKPFIGGDPRNVLIIGDPHAPFTKDGYKKHCREVQEKFNCGTVVFIGDLIDNHYSSFHDSDPDGFGAGEELDRALVDIQEWYQMFPEARVCLGNHDDIISRKMFASGVSKKWLRGFGDVLETPNWEFDIEFEIDGVIYQHGTGSSGAAGAYKRAVNRGQSVVQGHIHTEAAIIWHADKDRKIFGMQVGCGVDQKSYAMAYAKNFTKKYIISCAVVLEGGALPIVVPMDL